jgi:diacylglycerol kinase (ATP)
MGLASEFHRFRNTVRWSWQGLRATWSREASFRQWSIVNLVSASLAFALPLAPGERALILALGLLVLAAELLNTAIEEAVDYISEADNPRAGRAKDAGSAAVAVTAVAGGIAWLVILSG